MLGEGVCLETDAGWVTAQGIIGPACGEPHFMGVTPTLLSKWVDNSGSIITLAQIAYIHNHAKRS